MHCVPDTAQWEKIFFAVLYRSPSQTSTEFEDFTNNFELMLSKMSAENPDSVIITGDVNCRSSQWWENDTDNEDGKIFETFILTLVSTS